jgi:hypothetical protein
MLSAMGQPAVLLVESAFVEATLARAALALRSEVLVLQAEDLRAATGLLERAPIALAILGKAALDRADGSTLGAFARGGVPVVGVGVELTEPLRKKALDAGVREVHERPREWRAYRSLISALVDIALATRAG